MEGDFRLDAVLTGIGIDTFDACFFAVVRALLPALVLTFFFPELDEVALPLAAAFFFLAGVPICMFMGILDFEESCAVCCGCCARAGTAKTETKTSAEVRRHALRSDDESIVHPKFLNVGGCGFPRPSNSPRMKW